MVKNIIREYFAAFRWRRIKESYHGSNWWIFLYILIIVPLFSGGKTLETGKSALGFYSLLLPVMFHLFTVPLHPFTMPKMMYLCPMTKQERRKYLEKSYAVKILFSLFLALLGQIILLVMGDYDIFMTGMAFVLTTFLIFATSLQARVPGNAGDYSKSKDRWETVTLILFLFEIVVLTDIIAPGESCSQVEKIIFLVILFAIDLPLTLKILSFWKETVEGLMHYEKRI